jgi:hypothetical protein
VLHKPERADETEDEVMMLSVAMTMQGVAMPTKKSQKRRARDANRTRKPDANCCVHELDNNGPGDDTEG